MTAVRTRAVEEAATPDSSLRRRALAIPSARSLLFTVLGEYVLPRGGLVWTSTLIDALGVLGVEEKAARQAMARTAADGWLHREPVGRQARWRLTEAAHELLREGADRIYSFGGSQENWDGRWVVLVANLPDASRDERHRLRTRLAWAGFGSLRPGVWIAAHIEREREARRVLDDLGLSGQAVSFVANFGAIGDETELVSDAWDLEELEARYEDLIETFRRLRPTDDKTAFDALTRLVHAWRKFPFLDPALPARLLPSRWSGNDAHDLFHERHRAWSALANDWFDAA